MGIQDILIKQREGFMQALGELFNAKKNFYWDKAFSIIRKNFDESLWATMKTKKGFDDKSKNETIEFQLKLKYHEIDILKTTGKEFKEDALIWIQIMESFSAANPETYFYELENKKSILSTSI